MDAPGDVSGPLLQDSDDGRGVDEVSMGDNDNNNKCLILILTKLTICNTMINQCSRRQGNDVLTYIYIIYLACNYKKKI